MNTDNRYRHGNKALDRDRDRKRYNGYSINSSNKKSIWHYTAIDEPININLPHYLGRDDNSTI